MRSPRKKILVFSRLFRSSEPDSTVPAVPPGFRVYAIGDVHGRADLLDALLGQIERDMAEQPSAQTLIIFLGDLIDRGPDSAAVLQRVRTYRRPGVRVISLCGNHEEVLLRILRGESDLIANWLRFGGAECAASYGLDPKALKHLPGAKAVEQLRKAIPREDRNYLQRLGDTVRVGSYVFVHAGLRPGVALAEQAQADLRWIREPFLGHEGDHGAVVVHGHTICEAVEQRPNRIGIDTGAYRSGVLTALVLEGSERRLLQTAPEQVREPAPAEAS
jgi:serine/threonine protein phosphatase 1